MARVTQLLSKLLVSFISYLSYASILYISHLNVIHVLILIVFFLASCPYPGYSSPLLLSFLIGLTSTHSSGLSLNITYWSTWVAQLVKASAFSLGPDPKVLGSISGPEIVP